ncbi:Nucleic acid binding, OB-fold, tRNA/helicase-type [Neorhizobium galegae bv. officinalis]|uniref:Nucleic acid binding, OB-fold, tRNA/helicase-type n=1 Tax=Neorhizobium galegae bv. officinalis TaxID=323656 RepID=A0A0T7GFC8_NEOGA|nr:Nucleic acid binding, OB-fold, tRNA/helicase-type [Neorhizobium galegae bv. officinalis]
MEDWGVGDLPVADYGEMLLKSSWRWVYTSGLVLVRQKPGSAKGVMFITIEDETGPANLVVWPTLFEKRRRVVLGSSMMAINGRIQREGEVVHLVAQQIFDLSGDLVGLADGDEEFKLPAGRGDEFARGGGPDPRDKPKPVVTPRDMFVPVEKRRPAWTSIVNRLSRWYAPYRITGRSPE